ncbi:hypothetical protein [Rhizobium leguminosarum]|uniref:hypothetical protein n=1 Tax=Rhizobium leguminosarum TaxID=384 RepID=UPI0013F1ECD6|nr:hypothetical protein [Rhizobium leguminosarum]MBY5494588.1 hypothetical protein [Rhizobium leguminosarum]
MDFDIVNLLDSDEAMEAGDSKFIAPALGVQIPMKPPLYSEMIAPPDSGMISPP